MSDKPIMPTLEPMLIPEGATKRRKKKAKGPAAVLGNATTDVPESPKIPEMPEPPEEETGTWLDNVGDDERDTAVQNLLQAARGASLILWSLCETWGSEPEWDTIASGLYSALRIAADAVDASYFARAGELAETLEPRILAALLMKKLKRVQAEMAKEKT